MLDKSKIPWYYVIKINNTVYQYTIKFIKTYLGGFQND